jgi:predicted DsbA family dithiol-disulfide isomerase
VRLDDLKDQLGDKIAIKWKSFMLRPSEQGQKTREEFLEYSKLWGRMSELDPRLVVTAPWGSDDPHPSHSLPALAASKLVETFGDAVSDDFHHRMFKGYFFENRTISETGVVRAVAAEAGVDPVGFTSQFAEQRDELNARVIADHNEAIQLGVNAVPTVVVNNEVAIPGAQDTAIYLQVVEEMFARG